MTLISAQLTLSGRATSDHMIKENITISYNAHLIILINHNYITYVLPWYYPRGTHTRLLDDLWEWFLTRSHVLAFDIMS